MMSFTCQQCGSEVRVEGVTIFRKCGHDGVPIAAHMRATAYGESHMNQKRDLKSFLSALLTRLSGAGK